MLFAEVALPVPLFRTFHYTVPERLRPGLARGSRVMAPFGPGKSLSGVVVGVSDSPPVLGRADIKFRDIESLIDPAPLLTDELLDLGLWLSERWLCPLGEALQAVIPGYLKASASGGPAAAEVAPAAPAEPLVLTPSQQAALEALGAMLAARKFAPAVLFGLPASGKTEVYLRLAERAIAEGGQVLFLVPEISLTPPFIEEFAARLKTKPVVWHAQMPHAEKRRSWLALARGERQVVIGARSACLLPFRELRLAVLDEEQDESYKQDTSPKYHAREVLLERARRHGSLLVLGSATPSLETLHAGAEGRWAMVELRDRVSEQKELPRVLVADRRKLKRDFLNPRLIELMGERLARKEQVILLVNRRGFASFILCRKCGWTARCKSCGVALVHHRMEEGERKLRCHHCSYKMRFPVACPQCAHPGPLFEGGAGTQRVTQALKEFFPEARVLRLDRDAAKGRRQSEDMYRTFKNLEADIFVGTKLVSKGFHFPEVTLVGVVDADTPLNLPDFRAAEKTFQLLFQVAGRAGRGEKEGLVVVQTSQPDHYVIEALLARDYHAFARTEMEFRRELNYPPFSHLLRVLFSGSKEERVQAAAEKAAEALGGAEFQGLEVLGPSPGVYARLRGRSRWQLLVKAPDWKDFRKVHAAVARLRQPPGVAWSVDVDPLDIF